MENKGLTKLEKRLRILFLILAVIAVSGILLLIRMQSRKPYLTEPAQEEQEEYDWEKGLSDATYWLPEYCALYEELPEFTFTDEENQTHSIKEWQGENLVLVFWASWCQDCSSQMAVMRQLEQLAEAYGQVTFLYINQTDGERETPESAGEYFEPLSLSGELYFDSGEKASEQLGIRNIPTTLFVNREGILTAWSASQIEEPSVFEAMLKNAFEGGSKATADFVKTYMMDEAGGIHSSYVAGEPADANPEVLSESQGLGLLYAVSVKDQALFDKLYGYLKENMQQEGLMAWKTKDKKAKEVNALIDDFRIYRALLEAEALWKDYAGEIQLYEEAFAQKAVVQNRYVDFYDFENEVYGSRFTLCYGDLEAMKQLYERTEKPELGRAYENALGLMERGQISNEFPLYYSWYDYEKERYAEDDLNMAEAMITLLHLAQQGKLKNNTIEWLKARMEGEGIMVRYTVQGEMVNGYHYESTAVYAIIVMLADEIGDDSLRSEALKRMEKMHITDTSLAYNGAYGLEDGSGITSFDQLMPMLAYRQIEK